MGIFDKQLEEMDSASKRLGLNEHKDFKKRLARLEEWALKQDPRILAKLFSFVASEVLVRRKELRFGEMTSRLHVMAEALQKGMLDYQAKTASELASQVAATTDARRRGMANKLAKDPIQAIKPHVLALWEERNAGKHPNLRRVQDFATEAMRRWPVLTNAKTIEGWSAKWTKQVKAGENPSC